MQRSWGAGGDANSIGGGRGGRGRGAARGRGGRGGSGSNHSASGNKLSTMSLQQPSPDNESQQQDVNDLLKFEEIKVQDELDSLMGFYRYTEGPPKLGWMVNMAPVSFCAF